MFSFLKYLKTFSFLINYPENRNVLLCLFYFLLQFQLSKAAKREPAKVRNVRWKDLRDIFALAYPCRRRIYSKVLKEIYVATIYKLFVRVSSLFPLISCMATALFYAYVFQGLIKQVVFSWFVVFGDWERHRSRLAAYNFHVY